MTNQEQDREVTLAWRRPGTALVATSGASCSGVPSLSGGPEL